MIKRHTIEVEHIRIESAKSFADVRAALERNVPQLDPTLIKALADGDVERRASVQNWQPPNSHAYDQASAVGGALCTNPGLTV
jgi:hypothetical protein